MSKVSFSLLKSQKKNHPPILVTSDKQLMTKGFYRRFADAIGYSDLNIKNMGLVDVYPHGISVKRNGCYGHRHWLAIRDNKIVGLTVSHAGWMTERYMWKKEGFEIKIIEFKGWGRTIQILKKLG